MRIGIGVWAALLLVGCGPPNFDGRYRGKMDAIGSCAGTSVFVEDALWILVETTTGLEVTLVGGVACPTLKAPLPADNVAKITPKTCNSFVTSAGWTVQEYVREGGTMTLTGDTLKVAFDVFASLRHTDGRTGGCNDSVGGTLTR